LQAITGVFNGVLIRTLTRGQALNADTQTLVVHHGEHRRQALFGASTIQVAPSKFITQVAEALIPILCSIEPDSAFAAPGCHRH
jgi:hypothetical protein